jgi:hypothetical protein
MVGVWIVWLHLLSRLMFQSDACACGQGLLAVQHCGVSTMVEQVRRAGSCRKGLP